MHRSPLGFEAAVWLREEGPLSSSPAAKAQCRPSDLDTIRKESQLEPAKLRSKLACLELVEGPPVGPHEPTLQLVRDAMEQSRELLRLEVALARDELTREIARTKAGVIALLFAASAAIASCTLFLVAIALAFSGQRMAVLFACGLLLPAVGLGLVGYRRLPIKPMAETTARIAWNVKQIKERIQ